MIKNCKYIKNTEDRICGIEMTTQDDKIFYVSRSPNNADYQKVLEWVEAGNTIQEAD
tara:strand:- start:45 stop:215 length:171 start_codon:yes stop_codon:yes gene_type:complete